MKISTNRKELAIFLTVAFILSVVSTTKYCDSCDVRTGINFIMYDCFGCSGQVDSNVSNKWICEECMQVPGMPNYLCIDCGEI